MYLFDLAKALQSLIKLPFNFHQLLPYEVPYIGHRSPWSP